MGQYQVIALNRGQRAGLEPGHVLAHQRRQRGARQVHEGSAWLPTPAVLGGGSKVQLPDEHIGLVMVFKSYDRMSYALVMEASHEIRQGDFARNP